jgi:hypothetical protein
VDLDATLVVGVGAVPSTLTSRMGSKSTGPVAVNGHVNVNVNVNVWGGGYVIATAA